MLDEILMSQALNAAWQNQTLTLSNPAVGALVYSKKHGILGLGAHQKAGLPHAEVLALSNAALKLFKKNGDKKLAKKLEQILQKQDELQSAKLHNFLKQNARNLFNDCKIFVTLEPCNHSGKTPPCAQLLKALRPKKVIIAYADESKLAKGGAQNLKSAKIKVKSLDSHKARELLRPFLSFQKNGKFNLFKLALRLDGSYKNGAISGKQAQIFTHNMRSVADSIIISGATFRVDNPRLDCRFALQPFDKNHLPKVQILSHSLVDLSHSNLKNRDVKICDEIQNLKLDSGFNIIEGGWELFAALKDKIDMLLLYTAPKLSESSFLDSENSESKAKNLIPKNLDLKILHTDFIGGDLRVWLGF